MAAAIVGRYKEFVSRIREKRPVTHCFLHREALVSKALPADSASVLNTVVSIVNFVKTKPLKTLVLAIYVKKCGQNTQICCSTPKYNGLSRGKALASVYHLRNELIVFLNNEQREEERLVASDN